MTVTPRLARLAPEIAMLAVAFLLRIVLFLGVAVQ
jgi:hypothetical protein